MAVKREIPGRSVGDHQFTAVSIDAASDLRVYGKHRHCCLDLLKRATGLLRRSGQQKLDDPIEVFEGLAGID